MVMRDAPPQVPNLCPYNCRLGYRTAVLYRLAHFPLTMSITPPPSESNGAPAVTATTIVNDGDGWRASVLQSYRNAEVREIAKVLAALEPGVSASSKLMLAMRFEDAIFKGADSLADYRKKLTKRLKKLQKNYVPPAVTEHSNTAIQDQLLLQLRQKYGDPLRYIYKNATKAIQEIQLRLGAERAGQLQQHTDSAKQWAADLGVLELNTNANTGTKQPLPPCTLAEAQLQKLQQHLERRVDNIRSYVVKHADPDLFLQETLERKDQELNARATSLLGVNLKKRVEQLQHQSMDPMTVLQQSLEKSQTPVPPPTRNNQDHVPAALLHVEKMRAASMAVLSYLCTQDRSTAPRQALTKSHTVAIQGMAFCKDVVQKMTPAATQVQLQDAWLKILELPQAVVDVHDDGPGTSNKKAKWDHLPPVVTSRVLLTPNRKTPSNLLLALKQTRATLVRPSCGMGTHLILEFGNAFQMMIYLCPLVVTLRAMAATTNENNNNNGNSNPPSFTTTALTNSTMGCATWTPLYTGLKEQPKLQVWGVEGTYESLGHVVEERLRDASMHATHVLRKCFRNSVKDKTSMGDFEVELLEATALLEFLHLSRRTFMPQWQDEHDPTP
jgi:hypothetical protein